MMHHYFFHAMLFLLVICKSVHTQQFQQQIQHNLPYHAAQRCLTQCTKLHTLVHGECKQQYKISPSQSIFIKKYLEQLIALKGDIALQDDCNNTILMHLSEFGATELVQQCLVYEADPSLQDLTGQTALMKAAYRNHYGAVEILLQHNASLVEQIDKDGWSALTYAATQGNEVLIKLLIQYGADIHLKDKLGRSIAENAREHGHQHITMDFLYVLHKNNKAENSPQLAYIPNIASPTQNYIENELSISCNLLNSSCSSEMSPAMNSSYHNSLRNSPLQLTESKEESEDE